MRTSIRSILAIGLLSTAGLSSWAGDYESRFAVRAGFTSSEPTGESLAGDGMGNPAIWSAEGDSGAEIGFEWFATDKIGLELLIAQTEFGLERESASGELEVGDFEATSVNLLVNYYVFESRRVDLSFGFHVGAISYGEVEFEPPLSPPSGPVVAMAPLESGFAMGVQSTVDVNIADRWAAYAGIMYQDTSTSVDSFTVPSLGVPFNIPVNPMHVRIGGRFRFGSGG